MSKKENARKLHLRQKLISAAAMLLVASVLLVSSSYAWFVMSTAPEVANIQTQVGANGALEVALLNADSWVDLDLLNAGDIDESVESNVVGSNLTWGNLVDLSAPSYGMSQIVLNPSRLNIEANGVDEYAVNETLLKTPLYGEDGRIKGLEKTAVAFICGADGNFTEDGYGVRAIGTSSNMSEYQLAKNTALSSILSAMAAARHEASVALSGNGDALAGIVMKYAVSSQTDGYTKDDYTAVRNLAEGLQGSLNQIELGLRAAFAGFAATSASGLDAEGYQAAVAAAADPGTSLTQLLAAYPGTGTMIPQLGAYITKLTADQTTVQNAIDTCDAKINGSAESFTWNEISASVSTLMDTDQMLVGGMTVDEVKARVFPDGPSGSPDYGAALALLNGGGVAITVPSGSGLLSDVADFAGDYSASLTVRDFSYGSIGPMDVTAMMNTATDANPLHMTDCANRLRSAAVSDAAGSPALTDFYGYAIDLAFRTNAEDSHLLLQTAPQNRIYSGDSSNASLQGGGSYMSFTTMAGLSATKMVRLMQGLRVVFMDDAQHICAIAVLDCGLGQDIYEVLSAEEQASTGMYAYLIGTIGGYQPSDLISQAEYNALPEEAALTIDPETGEIKALLYLHEFSMTLSTAEHDTEGPHYTGGTTIGVRKGSQAITSLPQDIPVRISALVYLDGSYVTNAMVAANATQSMTGTLNLQFASDAELIPAEVTKLRQGDGEDTEESGNDEPVVGGSEPTEP